MTDINDSANRVNCAATAFGKAREAANRETDRINAYLAANPGADRVDTGALTQLQAQALRRATELITAQSHHLAVLMRHYRIGVKPPVKPLPENFVKALAFQEKRAAAARKAAAVRDKLRVI